MVEANTHYIHCIVASSIYTYNTFSAFVVAAAASYSLAERVIPHQICASHRSMDIEKLCMSGIGEFLRRLFSIHTHAAIHAVPWRTKFLSEIVLSAVM